MSVKVRPLLGGTEEGRERGKEGEGESEGGREGGGRGVGKGREDGRKREDLPKLGCGFSTELGASKVCQ